MTRKKVLLGAMVFIACVFSSCEKNELIEAPSTNEVLSQESSPQLRATSSIPAGTYSILQKYKDAYVHINQFDNYATANNSTGWPRGTSNPGNCSWSNYTIAVGCVGRASGTISSADYQLDKARNLKTFMKTSRKNYSSGSVMEYIYNDYGLIHDNNNRVGVSWRTTSKASSNHDVIAEELINHLRQHKTPIVIIGTTAGGSGHYFTVVSIYWSGNIDSSDIWVCDSTKGSSGNGFKGDHTYSIGLRTFLNRLSNGSNSDYSRCNMLFTYDLNP